MDEGSKLLENHRASIDRLDAALLPLLSERLRILKQALAWKTAKNRPLTPSVQRIEEIKGLANFAEMQGLTLDFVQVLFRLLYDTRPQPDPTLLTLDLEGLSEQAFRTPLKRLEQALILILAQRFAVVSEIGQLKARQGLPPLDPARWEALMRKKRQDADQWGLPWSFVLSLFEAVHTEALKMESLRQG